MAKISKYSGEELSIFIKEYKFDDYISKKFEEESIDGEAFLELTDRDLQVMKIKVGDQKKLLKLRANCRSEEEKHTVSSESELQQTAAVANVGKFNKKELSKFLKQKHFADTISWTFEEENIDGEAFLELTDRDLQVMKIKIGDQKRLLKLLTQCRSEEFKLPVDSQSESQLQKNVADIGNFSKEELSTFLKEKKIAVEVIEILEQQSIEGEDFLQLTKNDLSSMHIKIGDQYKLLKLLELCNRLQEDQSLEPPPIDLQSEFGSQKAIAQGSDLNTTTLEDPNMMVQEPPPGSTRLQNDSLPHADTKNGVMVTFNAIVPAYLWGWDARSRLLLSFRAKELGGFNSGALQLEHKWSSKSHLVFDGCLEIGVNIIKTHQNLSYIYRVETQSSMFRNDCWENIQPIENLGGQVKFVYRALQIPQKEIHPGGTWIQYDTIICPRQSIPYADRAHILNRVNKFLRIETDDEDFQWSPETKMVVIKSLNVHLQRFEDELIRGIVFENGFSEFGHICREIPNIYHQMHKQKLRVLTHSRSDNLLESKLSLKEPMCNWLVNVLCRAYQQKKSRGGENQEHLHDFVLSGAALAYIAVHLELLNMLKEEECVYIAELLLLHSDGKSCIGYEKLLKSIPHATFQGKLADCVAAVSEHIIAFSKGKNKSWLKPIPLFHFLAGVSEPYKPLPYDHTDIKWILWNNIKKIKKHFRDQFTDRDRFEVLWRTHNDLIMLDPLFSTVMTQLCPINELQFVLLQLPVVVATSYVIELYSNGEMKPREEKLNENQFHSLKICMMAIKSAVDLMKEDDWINQGSYIFPATLHLMGVVMNYIQSPSDSHAQALKFLLEHVLFVFSAVIGHKIPYPSDHKVPDPSDHKVPDPSDHKVPDPSDHKVPDPSVGIRKINNLLMRWIEDSNVIGGKCFGGWTGQKLKEELKIWVLAFTVVCPNNDLELKWKNVLKQEMETRTQEVDDNKTVEIFLKLGRDKMCTEEIFDVFIKMGMKGLEEEKSAEILKKVSSDQVKGVGKLLSRKLKEHCNEVNLLEANNITLKELLTWKLWPSYIYHCQINDLVFCAMDHKEMGITKAALSKVFSSLEELKKGSISTQCLKMMVNHRETMKHLCDAACTSLNLAMYASRLEKLEEHLRSVQLFFHSMCDAVEGYSDIDDQLKIPVDDKPMKELCVDWEKQGEIFVCCNALGDKSPLYPILKHFVTLAEENKTEVFRRKWWKCIDEIKHKTELSQDDFVKSVWEQTIVYCYQLLKSCADGSVIIADFIDAFDNLETEEIKQNLLTLHEGLAKCFPSAPPSVPSGEKWIAELCRQFKFYQQASRYSTLAGDLLKLKSCLKRSGKHKRISDLAGKDDAEISKYQLSDINESFILTFQSLEELSDKTKCECIASLIDNWEVVVWIMQSCEEISQLQAFIDVALTTTAAGEDHLATRKLTALRIVGNAVADFITELHKVERSQKRSFWMISSLRLPDDHDESLELIELCDNFWLALEVHPEIPQYLVECKKNLGWYTDIKNAQGHVHRSTLKELDVINNKGCFIIGKRGNDVLSDISNAFQLTLDKELDKVYDLEKLQDLESRLVLLAGKNSENTKQVHKFLNVFHTVRIIADTLVKLHAQGCVYFIGWEFRFQCKQNPSELHKEENYLSRQLKLWEGAVNIARNNCYSLNSFTMKQLLLLRKELVPNYYHNGEYKDVLHPQAITLLKYLFPCTEAKELVSTVKKSWELLDKPIDVFEQPRNENANVTFAAVISSPKQNGLTREEIVETVLTPEERIVYTRLTTTEGYSSSTWIIAELLQVTPRISNDAGIENSIDELSDKILEMSAKDEEPSEQELVDIINKHLEGKAKLQVEHSEDTSMFSDEFDSQQTEDDERSVLFDVSTNETTVVDMLDMRTVEYISLNQLSKLIQAIETNLYTTNFLQEPRIISGIDVVTGSPNLFVTADEYVIPTTLSLYASDKNKPLPTQEEVLVCNEETTAEQVILFWRRSIFDPEFYHVFCLVHGEKLSYSVCDQALRELTKLKQGKLGYRLIIVCSSDKERKSHLVTSLHQFKRTNLDSSPEAVKEIKSYLQRHLIKPKHTSIGTSPVVSEVLAHLVDPQGSYIRVVQSTSPGMGKTLYIKRMGMELMKIAKISKTILSIPIHGPLVEIERILLNLCETTVTKIIHFDIAPSMVGCVTSFLFSVLVLGHLSDHKGRAWRRELTQMFCIEVTASKEFEKEQKAISHLLQLFPSAQCHPPTQQTAESRMSNNVYNVGMDQTVLKTPAYQRVYHYLHRFHGKQNLDDYQYSQREMMTDSKLFIKVVLRDHVAKSWADLSHYIEFLNIQLVASEQSPFCTARLSDFRGMKSFVVKMMIIMSKEFASTSLMGEQDESELAKYAIKHTWNDRFHPYLFFNQDQNTITFMGFCINKACDAIDPAKGDIIIKNVISDQLRHALQIQGVCFLDDYRTWEKDILLINLGRVIGLTVTDETPVKDPDSSYVITVDNVMKMMAIIMRFRCRIPVVIMGETGCGKTRLLKYLCDLASQDVDCSNRANFVVLKVHGGTNEKDIINAVRKAESLAKASADKRQTHDSLGVTTEGVFGTVLFFDEANTTEHVNLIKEIMCDRAMFGEEIHKDLRIVVACNPYRRHSIERIKKLESAGLGFYTKSFKTKERLGKIPLRELVYRVHELPPSMMPLIFDFGRLDSATENKYIHKIICKQMMFIPKKESDKECISYELLVDPITDILSWSQEFMRKRKNECSFVSLRDIDRAMIVFRFFLEKINIFGPLMDKKAKQMNQTTVECKITRSLILTLAVCYNARLIERQEYESEVIKRFSSPLKINSSEKDIFANEVKCCQEVLLDSMKLGKNIARNAALRENIFMILVCISLRIPLFLIGKPGSSKSLAKSIILDSMKGRNSGSELLKELKQVQIFSYQCSQLSTSESIIKVFDQAKNIQDQSGDKSKFVSVVVLDEVGLAEDSPNLPLKVLHPLLEDGTAGNSYSIDVVERGERVAFIGISNWALDPAKMNRGIMVTRCDPTKKELELSAWQICSNDVKDEVAEWLNPYFKIFSEAYLEIFNKQEREYFGLRDFYSLVKMLYWMCRNARAPPTWRQIEHAIGRNFGGFEEFDVIEIFKRMIHLRTEPKKDSCRDKFRDRLQKQHKDLEETKKKFFEKYKNRFWKKKLNVGAEKECKQAFINAYRSGDLQDPQLNAELQEDFEQYFNKVFYEELWPFVINPSCSPSGLIKASLANKERTTHGENRYLLFLTENYAALQTLQHFLETSDPGAKDDEHHSSPFVLFGSSFPKDKDYTQVCHNINSVKVCMETGRTVILLNLDHLYESLYDVLNQHYVYFGNMRYVDLGLQNHRFKCVVHDKFKLILIAEKTKVYNEFPTPLKNRLEKHFVVTSTILTEEQLKLKDELTIWVDNFTPTGKSFTPGDSFIGYQEDTPAAVVFRASKMVDCSPESPKWHQKVLNKSKYLLLQIAAPDALIRLRKCAKLCEEYDEITEVYSKQHHSSLRDILKHQLDANVEQHQLGCRMQVTTYNELLSEDEIEEIGKQLNFETDHVISCILQKFETEFEFSRKIREAFQQSRNSQTLLIVQCDSGHLDSDLIACAKYRVDDIREEQFRSASNDDDIQPFNGCCHVLFTVLIPREHNKSSFVGFLGGDWICAHIDDFCPIYNFSPVNLAISKTPLSSLFYDPDLKSPSHHVPSELQSSYNAKEINAVNVNYYQNLYKLIPEAVQKASPCPESALAKRSHKINTILYHLLTIQPEMNCDFYMLLVHHIWNYIKEREPSEKEWIIEAALDKSKLQEGGAFLKVLLRKLDEVIVEVFASVIAFIDQANNLSLIHKSKDLDTFWLAAFGSSAICNFGLTKNIIAKNKAPSYNFICEFPFSWVVHHTVDGILQDHKHLFTGEDTTPIQKLFDSLREHTIGDLLNRAAVEPMKLLYLNDLIQLTWPCTRNDMDEYVILKETKIISAMLNCVANSLLQKHSKCSSFSDIVCAFHFAAHLKDVEVTLFKQLVSVFPEIVEKIDNNSTHDLPLDVTGAFFSLKEMDSENKEQQRWLISKLHRYHQVHHVIDTVIYSYEHKSVVEKRPKWMAIQAVHMFIEHVVMEHVQYFNKTVPCSNRIRRVTSRADDFRKQNTLNKIELVLSHMHKEFSATHSEEDAKALDQSCIRFYIEIISKLSMGKTAPEDELIEKLLDTVFTTGPDKEGPETKDLTPFLKSKNDSVPVVRSFLLQLLLQNNFDNTRKHIRTYFEKAQSTLTSRGHDVLMQLQLLYSQLYEDSLFKKHSGPNKINQLIQVAKEGKSGLTRLNDLTNTDSLECVAKIRFVLHWYAEWINEKYFTNAAEDSEQHDNFQKIISELCLERTLNTKSFGPQVFLLKLLIRRYGEAAMQKVFSESSLHFILPAGLAINTSEIHLADHFVIYDTGCYNETKELLTHVINSKYNRLSNLEKLETKNPIFLALSIFMEVTQTFTKDINDPTAISRDVLKEIGKYFRESKKFPSDMKQLMSALFHNTFNGDGAVQQLFVQPNQNLMNRIYSSIVVHVATGFLGKRDSSLLQPFHIMLRNPQSLENAYMPAMPEDFAEDARRLMGGQLYECPNGHPYLVTECGGPMEIKTCPECAKAGKTSVNIGGIDHRLTEQNQRFKRNARPQTGYILGVATVSPAIPERSLSPAASTIIKILMHSGLIWTSCSKPDLIDGVLKIVKTNVNKSRLPIFFWEHLLVDLQCLQTCLSIGFDDAALLIHIVVARIVEKPLEKEYVCNLTNSKGRNEWENQFNQTYIQPILENVYSLLENARKKILEDDKQKHPPILDVVYERNIVRPDLQHSLWKYRPHINLEHLSQKIQSEGQHVKHRALVFFLKEETSLRATKYLPSIVKLQRFLYDIHHYRSSEEEVQKKTIGQFLNEISNDLTRIEMKSMTESIQKAWVLVRGKLQTHGRLRVPQEHINVDLSDETTSIAYLIPKTTGRGCCTTALVDHLVKIHNEFIDICMRIVKEMHATGRTWKSVWRDPSVQLKDLRDTQLLQYENRLMAVILAHCHYSLTVGQQHTDVEYDYAALEKHLLNEFVYGKPHIQLDIPHVVFRKDVYTGERFEMIRTKVPQMPLSAGVKGDILKQLTRIQQLKQALNYIDVVMGFLSAGGKENPNMSLNHYATKVLKIQDFNKVIGTGYCIGHILALWDVVAVELAKNVTLTGVIPYNVSECFQQPLPKEVEAEMNKDLRHVNLDMVLCAMNDFIEIHVRNMSEADHTVKWTIKDCLEGHLGIFPGDEYELEKEIKFLRDIPMSQVIEVWKVVVFYKKQLDLETGGQR